MSSRPNNKTCRAFVLIEIIVYLGLFAILIGGLMLAAYNVRQSSGRDNTAIMLQQEGNFLVSKIEWAMQNNSSAHPITISLKDKSILISEDGGLEIPLNNTDVDVLNLDFSDNIYPKSREAKFTIQTRTEDGLTIKEDLHAYYYPKNN